MTIRAENKNDNRFERGQEYELQVLKSEFKVRFFLESTLVGEIEPKIGSTIEEFLKNWKPTYDFALFFEEILNLKKE